MILIHYLYIIFVRNPFPFHFLNPCYLVSTPPSRCGKMEKGCVSISLREPFDPRSLLPKQLIHLPKVLDPLSNSSMCINGFGPISCSLCCAFPSSIILLLNLSILYFIRPLRHAPNLGQRVWLMCWGLLSLHSILITSLHSEFSSHICSNLKPVLFRYSSCFVVRIIGVWSDPIATSFVHWDFRNRCAHLELINIRSNLS